MKSMLLLIAILSVSYANFVVKLHRRPPSPQLIRHVARYGEYPMPAGRFNHDLKANPIDPIRNFEDVEYVANASLGTPQQVFSLVMDTGSSNLWVSSTTCQDVGCSNMDKFDPSKSSSYQSSSVKFQLVYGTGSCSGNLANETLTIPPGPNGIVVSEQTFGLATTVAAFFANVTDVDGIFGLGLVGLAVDKVVPPLDNMVAQGQITKRVFGVYLDSADTGSELSFGEIDQSKIKGQLKYYNYKRFLFKYDYYLIGFNSMSVNGNAVNVKCLPILGCEALLDTGTSYVVGPAGAVDDLIQQLNVKADCSNFDNGPNWQINIQGDTYVIPSNQYTIKDPDSGQCTVAVASQALVPFWIFGDTFLRGVYAVFDNEALRAGLANSR